MWNISPNQNLFFFQNINIDSIFTSAVKIFVVKELSHICSVLALRIKERLNLKKRGMYRVIQKEVYTFKNLFYKYYWTYGDVLYIDWRENNQNYFHTIQTLDVSPTCDAADIKSIIQLFPHSSQHITGNSSHSLSDVPLQIIDIRRFPFHPYTGHGLNVSSFCKINFWKCILLFLITLYYTDPILKFRI
jgi:hypothetical protein